MPVRRRNLRKGLVAVGFVVGAPALPAAGVGLVLIACGGALHLWSKGCLEQNRRLITAGPYRYTRNPFYLSNLLIDSGLCLVIGNPWVALVYGALWWIAYRHTIDAEEAKLAELFPEAFERYVARVPRIIPLGRAYPRESVTGHFSLDNAGIARGREYARLIGIALGPAVVLAGAILRREGLAVFASGHETELLFLLGLPAIWIVKLALAEIFRRPETALLPSLGSQSSRLGWALSLAGVAVATAGVQPGLAVLCGLWSGLGWIDFLGSRRHDTQSTEGVPRARRQGWSRLPAVAMGSAVAMACVLVLSQSVA